MALSALIEWDVQNGGNDSHGGGFKSGATGTDRSQSTTPHVNIDGGTITATVHTTTTQLNITGYTVLDPGDIGNLVNITGGTMTADNYEITNADAVNNRWTLDKSGGTAGQTGTGYMGGCKASPGAAWTKAVAGNTVWLKYNAASFDVSSTTANVANGRISITAGTGTSVSKFQGYDSTHGDYTSNRPTIKATTNTMTLVTHAGSRSFLSNMIVDAGVATGILGVATASLSVTHHVRVVGANTTAGFSIAANSMLIDCEASACTVNGFRSAGGSLYSCIAEAGTADAIESTGGITTCTRCFSINNTGGGTDGYLNSGAASALMCIHCLSYGNGQHGFNNPSVAASCVGINTIAYSNASGTGIWGNNGGIVVNCASGANSTNFGATAMTQIGSITLSGGDPFTNAAGDDFSLDNTAGQGALLRATGFPSAFAPLISTNNFADIGPAQHQESASTGGGCQTSLIGFGQQYLE